MRRHRRLFFTLSFPSVINILVVRIDLLLGGDLLASKCHVMYAVTYYRRSARIFAAFAVLLTYTAFFFYLKCLASTKMRENLTSPNPNETTNQHCHHASNQRANAKLAIAFSVAPFPLVFCFLPPFFFRNGIFSPCFFFFLLLAAWARQGNDVRKRSKNNKCDCFTAGVLILPFLTLLLSYCLLSISASIASLVLYSCDSHAGMVHAP